MGVRNGGQEGALAPPPRPWPAKIVCFSTFFGENSIFLSVFSANSMFLPPPGKFCPPLEKSLRTPMLLTCGPRATCV